MAAIRSGVQYRKLAASLAAEIRSGLLHPGDRLPTEAELTARHHVSRTTVRLALSELEREGLIVRYAGRGTFVRDQEFVEDAVTLATCGEELSSQGFQPRINVLRIQKTPAPVDVASALRVEVGAVLTEITRVRLADDSPICLDVTFLPEAIGDQIVKADLERERICSLLERRFGLRLEEMQQSFRAGVADVVVARALAIPPGSPIFVVELVAYAASKRPVEFQRRTYRGDRFRYELRLVDVQHKLGPKARVTELARKFT